MSRPHVSFETQGLRHESHNTTGDEYRAGAEGIDYFTSDGSVDDSAEEWADGGQRRRRASLSIRMPPPQSHTGLAFTALQYLPMPVMVLSSMKHIVLANESMGRLLGIDHVFDDTDAACEDGSNVEGQTVESTSDLLHGKTLGELGIDLLQGGNAVFVSWEDILQNVVDDAAKAQKAYKKYFQDGQSKDDEPSNNTRKRSTSIASSKYSHTGAEKTEVHDSAVDVVFSTFRDSRTGLPKPASASVADHLSHAHAHIQAKMIISVWSTEEEYFFTLTFTAAPDGSVGKASTLSGSGSSTSDLSKTTSRIVPRANTPASTFPSGVSSNSSSGASELHRRTQRARSSPSATPNVPSPIEFPPRGPPDKSVSTSAPTIFTKSNRLKDAILNSMSFPAYAMWRDQSFGVPNKAAIQLIYPYAEDIIDTNESARDFLSRYVLYKEDFGEPIPLDDIPILRLMREQKRFDAYRVGMYSAKDGSQMLYDVMGEPMLDDKGEFVGGLVVFHDVTGFQKSLNKEKERNERQFEDITNMIPQMIWRTTPTGDHDYYSKRWYDYTGLTVERSEGEGWMNAFHADDLAVAAPKWAHCLATGDEYLTEYRARNANGEWRWMLGRAVPMRDDDGTILKWFGTCTDIHELVLAREEAKQTRAQLGQVIEHARITLWAVDMNTNLSLFEGQPMYDVASQQVPRSKQEYLGMNLWDIMREQGRNDEKQLYAAPLEAVLSGNTRDETIEVKISSSGRWFRTRLLPVLRQERAGGIEGAEYVDGVVGVSMDITDMKRAEEDLQRRNRDNAHLMAQSAAAKEASKMKSQFLANMSHEIRTPIAGVIGMSELLLDDDIGALTKDQRECAENIQRSANGLLTVINDILDFSKVESGRLDIEEVQFDLSVVIQDVNKMLSFAAERKNLKYIDDIPQISSWKVMGDPGRLRQVMTNLLTNSIKFTSEGSVTMRVRVQKETDEVLEITFTIQDTGIGIEEEVRRKLFKPFSQADSSTARRFGGTGLGLTISKNLVELMHGSISLESVLGAGTKASFTIPFNKAPYQSSSSPLVDLDAIPARLQSEMSVSRASSDSGPPATPTLPRKPFAASDPAIMAAFSQNPSVEGLVWDLSEAERKKTNVLVVEDNPINQQIAIKTIRKLGFPVTAVWNGKEALEYLRSPSKDHPPPDVILMDVQMPIMDGYHATYKIRNAAEFKDNPRIQGTPIVAMTASAIQGDREKCQKSGMDDYLAKPVKKPNLERMLVKWAIEGRRKREELQKDGGMEKRPLNIRAPASFESRVSSVDAPQDQVISELDRLEFSQRNALERSSETVESSAMRKQRAEEKAMELRDEMLLQSAGDPKTFGLSGTSPTHELIDPIDTSHKLTMENMKKQYGTDPRAGVRDWNRLSMEVDNASSVVADPSASGVTSPALSVAQGPAPSSAPNSNLNPRVVRKSPLGRGKPD
ncbi:hypothetical protein WHR41_07201 [Cladosporium halotolerans]|uniref:histidine kinase n=1 Tax=Cladosporium halotolerans TaxID=1052096 RepID=A0AB34KFS6_9PEZI